MSIIIQNFVMPNKIIIGVAATVVVMVIGLVVLVYKALKPPLPKVPGTPGGPPVTSPRIKLADGRYLAYKEMGVSKKVAKHKIILVHGILSSKDVNIPISKKIIEELQIYIVAYDRAGYGDSTPYPKRTVKTEAYDIEELADKLNLGPKFYVMGLSAGTYACWGCLHYIPHRLAGATFVVPAASWWWPGFPKELAKEEFNSMTTGNKVAFSLAHYAPFFFHWYCTQKIFPTLNFGTAKKRFENPHDIAIYDKFMENPPEGEEKILQQGINESAYRDIIAAYSKWEFDPLSIKNPFPNGEGSVHMIIGSEDLLTPIALSRYVAKKLDWIKFRELEDYGHLLIYDGEVCDSVVRAQVTGNGP